MPTMNWFMDVKQYRFVWPEFGPFEETDLKVKSAFFE